MLFSEWINYGLLSKKKKIRALIFARLLAEDITDEVQIISCEEEGSVFF